MWGGDQRRSKDLREFTRGTESWPGAAAFLEQTALALSSGTLSPRDDLLVRLSRSIGEWLQMQRGAAGYHGPKE